MHLRTASVAALTLACCATVLAADPQVVTLWSSGAPGSEGKTAEESVRLTPTGEHVASSIHKPSITVYLPQKSAASGVGVVIAPGGGHRELWMDHEGHSVAKRLTGAG